MFRKLRGKAGRAIMRILFQEEHGKSLQEDLKKVFLERRG
jgi:hypothetical protein